MVTAKGYPTVLGYAEQVQDPSILKRIADGWTAGHLSYHKQCRCDLYNRSVSVTNQSTRKCPVFFWFENGSEQ